MAALAEGGALDLANGGFVERVKRKWAELPQSFANGWEQIKVIDKTASEDIAQSFEDSWNTRWVPAAQNGWTQITDAFGNGWEQIVAGFANGGGQINSWWDQGWTDLGTRLQNGRDQINAGVAWLWQQIVSAFANGWTQITTWWSSLWTTVWTTVSGFVTTISTTVGSFINGLITGFQTGWTQITGFFSTAAKTITDIVNGVLKTFEDCAKGIRSAFDGIGKFISDAFGGIGDFIGGIAGAFNAFFGGVGDKGRSFKGRLSSLAAQRQAAIGGGPAAPGSALARVQGILGRFPGLHITDTYSTPERDATFGIVRSPNSYHYDRANPAVDIAGPIPMLYSLANLLYAMGGWRQILWQVAGHYDHVHVAHGGGEVESSWPRMWGDAYDERTARLHVGETVLPKGFEPARMEAWQPPERRRDGDERSRAAVEIRGNVYTTDIDEFFDKAERAKRRAYALAAPATG
jgi:hypothetical protein